MEAETVSSTVPLRQIIRSCGGRGGLVDGVYRGASGKTYLEETGEDVICGFLALSQFARVDVGVQVCQPPP